MTNPSHLNELLALIGQRPFDTKRANILLQSIDDLEQVISDKNGYKTTLLAEAVDSNNLDAVQLLLEHGADPNYVSPDYDCAFWELQYSWEEDDADEDRTRYEIAKLFLSHGADPNLLLEGETIFDYVTYKFITKSEIGTGTTLFHSISFWSCTVEAVMDMARRKYLSLLTSAEWMSIRSGSVNMRTDIILKVTC